MEHCLERPRPDRPHTHCGVAKSVERPRPYTCEGGIPATRRQRQGSGRSGHCRGRTCRRTPEARSACRRDDQRKYGLRTRRRLRVPWSSPGRYYVGWEQSGPDARSTRRRSGSRAASRWRTWAGDRQRHRGGSWNC